MVERAFAETLKRFGANVRRRRLERGLTQGKLALEAGTDPAAISKLECGLRAPRLPTLLALAAALRTTPADLLQGIDHPDDPDRPSRPRR